MAFAFKALARGAVNGTGATTVYTAPSAGTKVQEITFGNNPGSDATVTVTFGGQFFGKWSITGTSDIRGNQETITMNAGLNSGETIALTWSTASASLTHHISGTELG